MISFSKLFKNISVSPADAKPAVKNSSEVQELQLKDLEVVVGGTRKVNEYEGQH
jgi:hypothetical protein